ncbi:hypothetical protein FACS189421_05240 [Bacteroidia bacterium]|nr:hypothetical protein FACS189421_05240 [Bacteroidia bacterium]GHT46761.1 hypothetical protein FACS189440_05510 [Bacteroidia bacterium]GHT88403.1 hypothetical protein FACS189474_3590 [Bacteroidia bacterium]
MEQLATLEAPVRKRKVNHDSWKHCFSCEEPSKVEAFLMNNPDVVEFLPSIVRDVKTNLDKNAQFALELSYLDEETLFIIAYTQIDREIASQYQSAFFRKIHRLYPEISRKIYLVAIHYEI